MNPERKKIYEDAAQNDQDRFNSELKIILEEVVGYEHSDETSKDFVTKVKHVGTIGGSATTVSSSVLEPPTGDE